MIPAIKAELRKLLTVRSTYLLSGIALLLVGAIAGYAMGYRSMDGSDDPYLLMSGLTGVVPIAAIFSSIVAILLLAHEYRYGTIMYSLVASNSRSKVLLAKVIALTVYSVVFTLSAAGFLALAFYVGVGFAGQSVVGQQVFYGDIAWRLLFFMWANVMTGLLFAALFRHVVGSVVAIFILPTTIEGLLTSFVLKDDGRFLPFTALQHVLTPTDKLSSPEGALVFLAYLAVAGSVAWLLFLRRDAN